MFTLRHLLRVSCSINLSRHRRRMPFAAVESLEDRTLLATFTVTNTTDAGIGSLRTAIADANLNPGPDNIRFSASLTGETISLASSLPAITDEVTIRGPVNSQSAITIDGQGLAGVRPFEVGPTAASVTFSNLTITGGNTTGLANPDGGGLLNIGPDTRLIDVRVTNNFAADDGGGVSGINGTYISHSEISNNRSNGDGGGLHMVGLFSMSFSQVVGNRTVLIGGGINLDNATATIDASTIASNSSGGVGGIHNSASILTGSRLLVAHNATLGDAGGHFDSSGTSLYTNSTFVGNSAGLNGGGLVSTGSLTLVNCTVVNNFAAENAATVVGGVYGSGTLNVYNTVIAQNLAPSIGDNDINIAQLDDGFGSNFFGTSDGDPKLGPLQDNGGPTQTMMPFHNSPLIDLGFKSRATVNGQIGSTPLQGDQRGFSRFVDGNLNAVVSVDIGAVEFNPGPDVSIVTGADAGQSPRITLYNQDGSVRWSKIAFEPTFTGGVRVAIGDVNGDGIQDVIAGEGPGGLSRFRTFDGVTGQFLSGGAPFGTSYSGGIFVASADINDDGFDDIITGSGGGFVSHVRVRSGANTSTTLRNIRVGSPANMDPVQVASGDVNNDGIPDIIASRGPEVKVFDGTANVLTPPTFHVFSPFGVNFSGSVSVASGDVNGDGFDDIIVGRGASGNTRIKLYRGNTGAPGGVPWLQQEITAHNPGSSQGVRVAARDIDGDGLSEVITTNGPGSESIVRTYWSNTGLSSFFAFTDEFLNNTLGMFVAVG